MTAKEKAEELVKRYTPITRTWNDANGGWHDDIETAKECALICAQQVVDELDDIEVFESGKLNNGYGQRYWQSVKYEIEKL